MEAVVFGKNLTDGTLCPSQCILSLSGSLWCCWQSFLVMLTSATWSRWCPKGLSTIIIFLLWWINLLWGDSLRLCRYPVFHLFSHPTFSIHPWDILGTIINGVLPSCPFPPLSFLLHLSIGTPLWKRAVPFFSLCVYNLFNYLDQHGLMNIYPLLWVITHFYYYLLYYSKLLSMGLRDKPDPFLKVVIVS